MTDPLRHDPAGYRRMMRDPRAAAALQRMHWLKLATGLLALGLIAAIGLMWRLG
jgi:hypothetical protein